MRYIGGKSRRASPCPYPVLGGASTGDAIAQYGRAKDDFFRRFLALENGIPSHDTFLRVFAKLDPAQFREAFGRWMAAACPSCGRTWRRRWCR